jgi:hypothetical protein
MRAAVQTTIPGAARPFFPPPPIQCPARNRASVSGGHALKIPLIRNARQG